MSEVERSKGRKVEKSGYALGLGRFDGLCAAKMITREGQDIKTK